MHWVNAAALIVMIGSGWGIYNVAPFLPFSFPRHLTLGGWLAGSLAWHFAFMWLLAANLLGYLAFGALSGHFRRRLLPVRVGDVAAQLRQGPAAAAAHQPGDYNPIQRLAYILVGCALIGICLSGLAVWKPIQLAPLCNLLGGYESARRVHFVMMTAIALFYAVHVIQVARHPRTVRPMVAG
jgi:thiosulfate reductase cytochrome b subunit